MTIGLIGCTNAGKSTLFNTLIGTRRAIVTDIPGTTRDLISQSCVIGEIPCTLVDAPGLDEKSSELMMIESVIQQSDICIFLVNHLTGLQYQDSQIHDLILKSGKHGSTIMVVNKIDKYLTDNKLQVELMNYHVMGYQTVMGCSATKKYGIEELEEQLKKMMTALPHHTDIITPALPIDIAIIGKPNTGKSTLINTWSRKVVSRVSEVAGTTLDYVTTTVMIGKKHYTLYDTAGIKRRSKSAGLESIAYQKTIDMLKYVRPITLLLVDGSIWLTNQDMAILHEIESLKLPVIITINKTDIISESDLSNLYRDMERLLRFIPWVIITDISAQTGDKLIRLVRLIEKLHDTLHMRISTADVNKFIHAARVSNPPKFPKNKICKLYYGSQVDINPPQFVMFINHEEKATSAFKRWTENVIRRSFGFESVPVQIRFQGKDLKEQKRRLSIMTRGKVKPRGNEK